jgi:hypothetical protein
MIALVYEAAVSPKYRMRLRQFYGRQSGARKRRSLTLSVALEALTIVDRGKLEPRRRKGGNSKLINVHRSRGREQFCREPPRTTN